MTLDVRRGEVVGIFGLVGAGRTELLETIFGTASGGRRIARRRRAGDAALGIRDAIRAGLALVPEDRQRFGLLFNLSIANNIALTRAARDGSAGSMPRRGGASRGLSPRSRSRRRPSLARRTRSPAAISRRSVAAKCLAIEPRVFLLDEPTKGVDVGAKFEIHETDSRARRAGMACLVVSSDLPEVLALTDRILVMREGVLRGELRCRDRD